MIYAPAVSHYTTHEHELALLLNLSHPRFAVAPKPISTTPSMQFIHSSDDTVTLAMASTSHRDP